MTFKDAYPELSLPPAPVLDRRGRPLPANLEFVIALVSILLTYGRHLAATLNHRATRRTFSVIAQYFGTAQLNFILARVSRGILRAMALERVLLERAARGHDLRVWPDGPPQRKKPAAPTEQQQAKRPPKSARIPRPDPDAGLSLDTLPTVEQLVAEIRRHRWIGRALVDICCDLGVGAGVCHGRFGTAIFNAMRWYRGSFTKYYKEMLRREKAYGDELDWKRDPARPYDWPSRTREGTRQALGFFVGEAPVMPDSPAVQSAWPFPRPT